MALLRRLSSIRSFYRTLEAGESRYLPGSSRTYFTWFSYAPKFCGQSFSPRLCSMDDAVPWTSGNMMTLRSTMAPELLILLNDKRSLATQVKAPAQARQMGALKVAMSSPGFIYEPYAPRESISFWRRWFTKSGWRRTKDDIVLEMKSAYALAKLRRSGYSKNEFYKEAIKLYKEISAMIANGDKTSLRKAVTENIFSALKNEIKQRESIWPRVYWELIEPVVKIRTLRARLIGVDRNDLNKVFVQVTLEILAKQKFEAYNSSGAVVAGDKNKEVHMLSAVYNHFLFFVPSFKDSAWKICIVPPEFRNRVVVGPCA